MNPAHPTMTDDQPRALIVGYFRRLNANLNVTDMFAENGAVRYPKWGVANGHAEIQQLLPQVGALYRNIRQYAEYATFVFGEHVVVVEGTSAGTAGDGTP